MKNAIPGLGSGRSTSTHRGVHTDGESTGLWGGADVPAISPSTHDDECNRAEVMSIPQNVSTY